MTTRVIGGLVFPGFLFAACFAANAAQPVPPQPQEQAQDVAFNGVKVAIDPKTGRIRPMTEAESKQLSDAVQKSTGMQAARKQAVPGRASTQPRTLIEARATQRVRADGSKAARVPASMMSELRVTVDNDGKAHFSEVNGEDVQPISIKQEEAIQ